MPERKPAIDWPGIKADYQAGAMGVRELARWYSLPESTIRSRAKAEGWKRPAAPPVAQPARRAEPIVEATPLTRETADPKVIVGRGRNLVLRLLDELETVTSRQGELEELILIETAADQSPKRREAMLKAVDLPSRANTIKALALAYKTLAEAGAPAGKKAEAQAASATAGEGTGWGDDLHGPPH